MVDPGGIDDAGGRVEAVAVEARRRLVDQVVVEDLARVLLVVVAADDRDRGDRGAGGTRRQRSGMISPRRAASAERQVVDGGWETSETCFAISCSVAVMPM